MDPEDLAEFQAEALATRADLFPGTVTYDGTDYEGSVDVTILRKEAREGGIAPAKLLSVEIAKADLADEPEIGDPVTYEGEEFTITEIDGAYPSDPAWFIRAELWPQ